MPTPPRKKSLSQTTSPLDYTVGLLGDRWSLLVIDALLDGPTKFGDLQTLVAGIAPNILTQRLRSLEQHGLVVARPYSERPVRLEYGLTERAVTLAAALQLLTNWGAEHGPTQSMHHHDRRRCQTCDTALEVRPWCPTCEVPVDPDAPGDLRWV